ncbi:uncharacterized protein LOC126893033 [Diabrotica virgifera virgifera]|uniref:Uncharacterized protein n=1 Tax=Diabrotica virgifera virgifera TaxID=50390 RepID=A0ABM5L915_DIAVI|nr:uncharacterized protein LOC126893033 [Diabrotica virgifera virgifera]
MTDIRAIKVIQRWKTQGNRTRERPRNRWIEVVEGDLKTMNIRHWQRKLTLIFACYFLENLLYSKWADFKKKKKSFHRTNINDISCKLLFSSLSDKSETNVEDYILATLLNSIILPTSRFPVEV